MSVISPGLRSLLSEEPDNRKAVEAIAASPAALSEALAVLPLLEREANRPAGEQGVMQVIGRRFALYPQPERSDEEAAAWWGDYFDVLADIPMLTLEAAMIAWVRTAAEFMPKPGQILALVGEVHSKEHLSVLRIKAADRLASQQAGAEAGEPERPPVSEGERAKVKAMLNEFRAQMPRPPQVQHGPRNNPAQVDERGVSTELRALVARQRGEPMKPGENQ